jgi:hypothetical protein
MAGNAPVKREPKKSKVAEAIAYERDLAEQAAKIRARIPRRRWTGVVHGVVAAVDGACP